MYLYTTCINCHLRMDSPGIDDNTEMVLSDVLDKGQVSDFWLLHTITLYQHCYTLLYMISIINSLSL